MNEPINPWRLAWSEVCISVRRWKSYCPAGHLAGGQRKWDRRASEHFAIGAAVVGSRPEDVARETLDLIYQEMFGNVCHP